jgi:ribonuclease-3
MGSLELAESDTVWPPDATHSMTTAPTIGDGLEGILAYKFSDPEILRCAITHASAEQIAANAYERLEFLGDRVLGLVVAERLLERFPKEREGEIARRHVQLVRGETLAEVARRLGIGQFLIISRGEEEAGARDSESILSDVMEALLAGLYLDGGLEAARRFILKHWHPLIEADLVPPRDAKTTLQEWAQGRQHLLPCYTVVAQDGPAHAPEFTISVMVGDYPPCTGTGRSKRLAEQAAATLLLANLAVTTTR